MMLELYHWEPNADSLALLACLGEKALEFRSRYVDMLRLENHAHGYLALSPHALVPVLVAEGEPMTDAGLALQYLAERFPEPRLAPADAGHWYDVQAWMAWLGGMTGLSATARLLGWNYAMLKSLPAGELEAFRDKVAALPGEKRSGWDAVWSDAEADEDQLGLAEERMVPMVAKIEAALTDADWLVGREYSIVDIAVFAHAHCLPTFVPGIVNPEQTAHTCAWLARVAARPAVKAALAMGKPEIGPAAYTAPGT